MTAYQVIAECCHVPVVEIGGVSAVKLLYKGAFVPDGVPEERIKFLLDGGFIAEPEDEPAAPNAAVEQDPTSGIPPQRPADSDDEQPPVGDGVHPQVTEEQRQAQRAAIEANAEVERKRTAAKAKLPTDGTAPHHNASEAVWVEYAVAQGLDRGESEKAGKAELMKALTPGK